MLQTFSFDAAGRQIDAAGTFIRYERTTNGPSDDSIRVRVDGNDLGIWRPGDAIDLPRPFSRVEVQAVGDAAGEIRVGLGRFLTSRTAMSGTIDANVLFAKAPRAAFTNAAKTVTTTSAQHLAPNAARQYLMIQNKHATGVIWVCFGQAATQANGLRISPGGYWEWPGTVPTDAVHILGDATSNADVLTVEG